MIFFRVAQGGGFRVNFAPLLADTGMLENIQPFRVGGHQRIFDAIVHHLDEVAGAIRSAVQITPLGRRRVAFAAGRAFDITPARSQCRENGIQVFHGLFFAPDHHAVAALQTKDAAAGAHIHIVDAIRLQAFAADDVVLVTGIAAVDDDVVALHPLHQRVDGLVYHGRRHHDPGRPRPGQFGDEVVHIGGADGTFLLHCLDRIRAHIEDHALVPRAHQSPHHVGAHAPQTNHTQLHRCLSSLVSRMACRTASFNVMNVMNVSTRFCRSQSLPASTRSSRRRASPAMVSDPM